MVHARRRKGPKDEDPLLPTTSPGLSNGSAQSSLNKYKKRSRAKALSRLIGRAVCWSVILLILVAAYPIVFPEAPHAHKIKAHWHKLAAFVQRKRQEHLLHKQQQHAKDEKDKAHHDPRQATADEQVSFEGEVKADPANNHHDVSEEGDDATEDDDYTLEALIAQNTNEDDDSPALTEKGCHGALIHEVSQQDANPPGICINDPTLLPKRWRAPKHHQQQHSLEKGFFDDGSPWTEEEQALAEEATTKGLDELTTFFDTASDEQIRDLGIDAMSSIMSFVLGSEDMVTFHETAVTTAIHVLHVSAAQLVGNDERADYATECSHMYPKTKLTGYAHRLHQERPNDADLEKLHQELIKMLNDSLEECSSDLDEVLAIDEPWMELIKDKAQPEEDVAMLANWAIALTECLVMVDDLTNLPEDTPDFVAAVWRYMEHYNLPDHRDYDVQEEDEDGRGTWVQLAFLATNLQLIPTGYGRHYHYVEDAPYLYHFYRDNFYAAFAHGGHNLVAELTSILSNYGCTVHNDLQVRHGVRYVLHLYKKAGHSFVNHRETWESDKIISDYEKILKPWTGIGSVMTQGCFEAEGPGSYGYAFRQALNVVPDEEDGEEAGDDATYKEEE